MKTLSLVGINNRNEEALEKYFETLELYIKQFGNYCYYICTIFYNVHSLYNIYI